MASLFKFRLLVIFIISGLMFSACQKELSEEASGTPPPPPPNTIADSGYLSKIYIRDTTFISGNFEVDSAIYLFKCDNQKRLIEVAAKDNELAGADSAIVFQFSYLQNDTLPFKVNSVGEDGVYYFFYDNQGRMIKDSVLINPNPGTPPVSYILRKGIYSYALGKIYALITGSDASNPSSDYSTRDTISLDPGGNIISSRVYTKNAFTTDFELVFSATSAFDNGLSPYVKVPAYRAFMFSYNIFFENFANTFRSNNIVSNSYFDNANNSTVLSDFMNAFYANGLLKKAYEITDDLHSEQTFVYKAL